MRGLPGTQIALSRLIPLSLTPLHAASTVPPSAGPPCGKKDGGGAPPLLAPPPLAVPSACALRGLIRPSSPAIFTSSAASFSDTGMLSASLDQYIRRARCVTCARSFSSADSLVGVTSLVWSVLRPFVEYANSIFSLSYTAPNRRMLSVKDTRSDAYDEKDTQRF
jgi:hypothetical protein